MVRALAEPTTAMDSESATGHPGVPSESPCSLQGTSHDELEENSSEDIPPAKKRRTFAGSIVSGAMNAAIIGAAVGLTVYRLWRDRGKEPEPKVPQVLPPPPYQQEWQSPKASEAKEPAAIEQAPTTPHRKPRHALSSPSKRPASMRTRRKRVHRSTTTTPPSPSRRLLDSHFFERDEEEDSTSFVEEKMDWMGGKLTELIEQGKRALGREVVVTCDAKEDEVDDGTGAWVEVEEEEEGSSDFEAGSSRGSVGSARPRDIPLPSLRERSPTSTLSPRKARSRQLSPKMVPSASLPAAPVAMVNSPGLLMWGLSEEREEDVSLEVREHMERARARRREAVSN